MGCANCSTTKNGVPQGCGNKGSCSSGSCNKMNTYDWILTDDINDPTAYHIVEVSFKKGARKSFFMNPAHINAITGDMVVVESTSGYDVGRISLSGELVRLQMKKKRYTEDRVLHSILRKANHRDLEKLEEARILEHKAMVRARVLARTLGLDMKIGDVEYQGDKRKATFYYTAEGRVDFRELVRVFAREYKVKIEMRQIGSRQESGRIGGVGACGRELCCSTWLSDFQTVTTSAARYQNISINQTKLSGQCGRLKCCLNFELEMYVEAIDSYPKKVDHLMTKQGKAVLLKIDIFKGVMVYAVRNEMGRNTIINLTKEQAIALKEANKKGIINRDIEKMNQVIDPKVPEEEELEFEDVTGFIELPEEKKKKSRGRGRSRGRSSNYRKGKSSNYKGSKRDSNSGGTKNQSGTNSGGESKSSDGQKPKGSSKGNSRYRGKRKNYSNKPKSDNKSDNKPNNPKNN